MESPQESNASEFDAFISYRRSDGAWAAHWLRRQLERMRLPEELQRPQRRALRCYIDVIYRRSTDDFFFNNIVPNLKKSRYLILVATPDAVKLRSDGQPNWVEREITEFLQTRQASQVIIARARGELSGPLPSALPISLAERSDVADLRGLSWLRRFRRPMPAYPRDELLTVAATLLGVTEEEMPLLRREEERLQRSVARQRLFVVSVLLVLFVALFFWAAASSISTRRELVRNHINQGAALFDAYPSRARLHFAKAVELARMDAAGFKIWQLDDWLARRWLTEWKSEPKTLVHWLNPGEEVKGISPDGRVALCVFMDPASREVSVHLLDLTTSSRVATPLNFGKIGGWPASYHKFTRDSKLVFFAGRVFNTTTGAEITLNVSPDMSVKSRTLSPDGKKILLTAKRLELYSLESGNRISVSEQRSGDFWQSVFTPDGRRIITVDYQGTADVWDAETLKNLGVTRSGFADIDVPPKFDEIPEEEDYDAPDAIDPVLSPNGRFVASDAHGGILISEANGLRQIRTLAVQIVREEENIRFSDDSDLLLAVEQGGGVVIWSVPYGHYWYVKLPSPAVSAFFGPNKDEIITVHADHGIRVWSLGGLNSIFPVGKTKLHSGAITAARLVPGGWIVTASTDGTVRSWPPQENPRWIQLDDESFLLGFDEDETHLHFWSPQRSALGTADIATGRLSFRGVDMRGYGGRARIVPIGRSGNGKTLLASSVKGEIVVIDASAGKVLNIISNLGQCGTDRYDILAVNHSGTGFAIWCGSNGIQWRRLPDGSLLGPSLNKGKPFGMALSDDLGISWIFNREEVLIVDPAHPEPKRLNGVTASIGNRALAFSADGKRALLAINTARQNPVREGIEDPTALRVLDSQTAEPISGVMVPKSVRLATISADGRIVASCGNRFQSWDAETGMQIGASDESCIVTYEIVIGPSGSVALPLGTQILILDLRPVTDPAETLRLQAEIEGVLRLDDTGAIQPISKEEWESRRSQVSARQ